MGELHLEVAVKLLKEYAGGIEIATSAPTVVYRETVTRKGIVAVARSPNKQNRFSAQVEPLKESFIRLIGQSRKARTAKKILAVDEQHNNVLVNCTGNADKVQAIADSLASGFEYACKAGPLCGEPLWHVKVNLVEIQPIGNAEYRDSVEVMHGVGKAIFGAILTAKPVLLEPVYKTVVTVPAELAGECSRILNVRRGKLSAFDPKGALTIVTAYVPVAETFDLAKELRSATSGRAFWQSVFDHWTRVPEKLAAKVTKEVRKRKGLPSEVPTPEKFMEES
jgi:elongation factor 2